MAGEILVYGEIASLAIGLSPFALHRLSCFGWMNEELQIPSEDSDLPITVLLPVWNEGLIIEKKLADLAKQEIKSHLLIIDSASNDDTVAKAKNWLSDYPDAFLSSNVIVMEKRLGKTAAVKQAIEALDDFKGIIVMTDADAMIGDDSFLRIRKWFNNKQIGVVGGTPNRIGDISSEESHREMYTTVRIAESHYDSTPFLEGSIIAWRSNLLVSSDLYERSNADDAQIATAIRLKGFRAVQDSDLTFVDQMPLTAKDQRRQKVRRGQGLTRLLIRKRKYWFCRKQGRFSKVLRRNAMMHILSPIAIFAMFLFGLIRVSLSDIESDLQLFMTILESYFLLSWLFTRANKPVFGMRTVGTILTGLENLLIGMLLATKGKSLHMWEQHGDVRIEISKK